jgi:hypothetical protein
LTDPQISTLKRIADTIGVKLIDLIQIDSLAAGLIGAEEIKTA